MEAFFIIIVIISLAAMNFSDNEAIMAFGSLIGSIAFIILMMLFCQNSGLL